MIRAVIFDCFGVLYLDASRYFYEHIVKANPGLMQQLLDLNTRYDYGYIDQAEHTAAVAELTGIDRATVEHNIWGIHKRNDALLEYSQSLRDRYLLGMCSNIGRDGMDSFFTVDELSAMFDGVVLSSEVGRVKPDPEIFRMTAQKLSVDPSECIMIDDIKDNCTGAVAAGMRSILYQTNQQLEDDLQKLLRFD